ncbi:oxygen-independent coproporphyrinogen-3 oxidase [Dyadobacter sp. SG02]|uniref:radical SAM family heme chaperone HemW n=1 Tax=Dyadobacter sp. SG02 TaxID=1855291 RepID=UPI0008C36E33|nr:radical SAM family heme chaperone HemW [Dyadobacter sp. SG02]SEJ47175.1 oxygen-independent coproporphyrinogen-3 oxidase [Dyadobacter sp. SG02]
MHLYIHIPFCKQACHYCDFHFSTNTTNKRAVVEAIAREIVLRKSYLPDGDMETIYFGGGTPSMLDEAELHFLLETIHKHFRVAPNAEITLEANPDDLNAASLQMFAKAGINRLSIGIQSFHEPHLRFMNRAHSAVEAEQCVTLAQNAGIDNISIDLIYAIPSEDHDILHSDLFKAFTLNVPHISAYCLTIEPQTAFGSWLKKKKMRPIEEEYAAQQFEILVKSLGEHGYEQYEISNFARNGHYSNHNSSYWKQHPYLGVGPSAHSYNGASREYNISNNAKYLEAIQKGLIPATIEALTPADRTNEYLLTGLRTKWGVELLKLDEFSAGAFALQSESELERMTRKGWIREDSGILLLTEAGKLFADRIASDLFID